MRNSEKEFLDALDSRLREEEFNDLGVAMLLKTLKEDYNEVYESVIADAEARMKDSGNDIRALIPEKLPKNSSTDSYLKRFADRLVDELYDENN